MLNRYLIIFHFYLLIGALYGQDSNIDLHKNTFISDLFHGRACVDSVISSLPFFHTNTLEDDMGDDWSFQTYPHGVDYTYQLTLDTPKKLYIDTCDPLTDFDTILAIKDTCGNEISIEEYDDGLQDFCPESGIPDYPYYASIIDSVYLTEGTYHLVLDGYSGATGNYAIAVGTLPEIVSSMIAEDDSYLEIHFSENMYTDATGSGVLEPSDFEISFNQNGGTATGVSIEYLANASGEPITSGEDTVRFYISVVGESTGQEEITIFPQNNASIFNSFGIGLLRSASITQGLSDLNPPSVTYTNLDSVEQNENVSLSSDIVIEFSEPIYNTETGQPITADDIYENVTLRYGDSSGNDIPFAMSIDTTNNQLIIDPISNFLGDTTVYFYFQGVFMDARGNQGIIEIEFLIATLDNIPPTSLSYTLAEDNSYIDIQFSDQMYGDTIDALPLQSDQFQAFISSNGSLLSLCNITSISRIDSYDLIGGENNVRVNLEYNYTPNGDEFVVLTPVDSIPVYDEAGNQFSGETFTSMLQLYDLLPPSIDSVSVAIDSFIILNENTPIIFYFNEIMDSIEFDVTSSVMDTVNFSTINTDTSIQIVLLPPFASYDSIFINFSYLEDNAELSTVDIGYTYTTPILGDYDLDNVISYNDMWDLVENWELKNYEYELGPVIGSVPHLISIPDSKFDLEDGMAFIKNWSWYQETFGEIILDTIQVGTQLQIILNEKKLSIIIDKNISAGRIQLKYKVGSTFSDFEGYNRSQNNMSLTKHLPQKGFSTFDFARTNRLIEDTIHIAMDGSAIEKIFYSFEGNEKSSFQKGAVDVDHKVLPEKFKLYPAYPNPFNPITTLKFDVPKSVHVIPISLSIFDITGRKVETLISEKRLLGTYRTQWNAFGHSSGVYFVNLSFGKSSQIQKILLLK